MVKIKVKKIYTSFKHENVNGTWCVTTIGGIIVATVPSHIRHKSAVAKALAEGLTKGDYALTDLI